MGKSTDTSRAERKAKKRALEDAIPDLPGDNEAGSAEAESSTKLEKKPKKRKRDREADGEVIEESNVAKKEKKDKKKRRKTEETEAGEEVGDGEKVAKTEKKSKRERNLDSGKEGAAPQAEDVVMGGELEAPKKTKKERKAERKAREAAEAASKGSAPTETTRTPPKTNGEATAISEEKGSKKNNRNREKKRKGTAVPGETGKSETAKAARFIVFIGNLPFTATTESIKAHFASVKPKSVRHLTQKNDPSKSRGCAFVEFDGYDHMKTCLKLFHHSMFDDGLSAPRKINVELTAGGGGNTKDRRAKIEGKNQKLNEERFRRIQEEEKTKLTKASEGGKTIDENAIHPSRRGRVPAA